MKLTALGRQQSQNIAGSKQSMQRRIVNNFRHKRQNTQYFWTVSIWDLYFNIGSYRFGKTTVKDNNNNKSQFSLFLEICFGKKQTKKEKPTCTGTHHCWTKVGMGGQDWDSTEKWGKVPCFGQHLRVRVSRTGEMHRHWQDTISAPQP